MKWKNKNNQKVDEQIEFEKKKYKLNKVNYLPSSVIGKILVLIFIIFDFMCIRQLVDAYFTQSFYQTVAISLVIACLIDVTPTILAGFISVQEKKIVHYSGMFMTLLALIGCFIVLGALRFNSEELIYQTSSTQITSLVSVQETTQSTYEQGYTWMSTLFCILPLFTSIVSFAIGILENVKSKEKYFDKINLIKSKEELFNLEADNLELEFELERGLNMMNDKYRALELSDIENRKTIAKELIKFKIAQAVGTPQALSNMEDSPEQ